jgi:hypothetical protein
MSFQEILNEEQLENYINNFSNTRLELKELAKAEETGRIAQEKAIEKFQKPGTSTLKSLLTSQVTDNGQTRTYTITDLINSVGYELSRQGVEQEDQTQILLDLSQDTINTTQALAKIGSSLYENGATQDEILQFVFNISKNIGDTKLMKDTVLFSDEVNKGINDQINELQTSILLQQQLINEEQGNMTEKDFNIITKALNDNKLKLDNLIDTKDKMVPVFDELFNAVGNNQELAGDEEIQNVILQTTSGTVSSSQTVSKPMPIGPPPPRFTPEENPQRLGELDISEFETEEIKFPDNPVYLDFTPIDNTGTIFSIFDNSRIVQIIDNKLYELDKFVDNTGTEKYRRIGQPIEITSNIKEFLINGNKRIDPTRKGQRGGDVYIELKDVIKKLNTEEATVLMDIYERVDFMADINQLKKNDPKRFGGITKKGKKGSKKFEYIYNLLGGEEKFGFGLNFESLKLGNGQSPRNPYKIKKDGSFGNLNIDVPLLTNQLRLKVMKGGQIMADQYINSDTFDLLTKRFNPKRDYSEEAINIFNELVQLAQLPITPTSGKFSLLDKKQKRGVKPKTKVNRKKKGGELVQNHSKITIKPALLVGGQMNSNDDLIDRMHLLVASLKSGNKSTKLRDELNIILDILLNREILPQDIHKKLIQKYIMN